MVAVGRGYNKNVPRRNWGLLAMPFAYALALVVVITLLGVLSLIFYADFKREIARRYPTVDWSHKRQSCRRGGEPDWPSCIPRLQPFVAGP